MLSADEVARQMVMKNENNNQTSHKRKFGGLASRFPVSCHDPARCLGLDPASDDQREQHAADGVSPA
jgi:hypothetical protein